MKRIISIILAVCMSLVLIVPTAGAADESIVYSLTYDDRGDTYFWTYNKYEGRNFCFFDADPMILAVKAEVDAGTSTDATITIPDETGAEHSFTLNDVHLSILRLRGTHLRFKATGFPEGRWFAMKLDASTLSAGKYDMNISSGTSSEKSTYNIWLAPYDSNKTTGSDYMTEENLITPTAIELSSATISDVNIDKTADDYIIVIQQNESEELRLNSITLTKTGALQYGYDFTAIAPENTAYAAAGYDDYTKTGRNWHYFDMESNLKAEDSSLIQEGKNARVRLHNLRAMIQTTGVGQWVAFKLKAPAAGVYSVNHTVYGRKDGTEKAELYLAPYNAELTGGASYISNMNLLEDNISYYASTNGTQTPITPERYFVSDGTDEEYLFIARRAENTSAVQIQFTDLSFIPVDATELTYTAAASSVEVGGTVATTALLDGNELIPWSVEFASDNTDVATVAGDGTVTAIKAGTANISATVNGTVKTVAIEVTAPEEDAELTAAFDYEETKNAVTVPTTGATVRAFSAYIDGTKVNADLIDLSTVPFGTMYTVTAPDAEVGYKFLYWAKGATFDKKQIVSTNAEYSFLPTVDATNLIAVYEPINAENNSETNVEFYNANGQLLSDTAIESGLMPSLPSMTGYGKAEYWAQYGSETTYNEGTPAPEISGTTIFVAYYGEKEPVTVNEKTYDFGTELTFTAAPGDGQEFKCWKKTVNGVSEIVSVDETYKFKAWEDCTVEEVCVEEEPVFSGKAIKIIIDTIDAEGETAVIAEFIGLENAIEKGIMFGNKKIAMTTKDSQFTVIDNVDGEAVGYAILSDGTMITDGE